jgi:hypothetical protein
VSPFLQLCPANPPHSSPRSDAGIVSSATDDAGAGVAASDEARDPGAERDGHPASSRHAISQRNDAFTHQL